MRRREVEDSYRTNGNYLSLESAHVLLEPAVAEAALDAAKDVGLRAAPTLVYLANGISDGKETIPYSVVAALDSSQPPPLRPFLPPGVKALSDDQIVLADWKESPLKADPSHEIPLTYFPPEYLRLPKEPTAKF